MPIALYSLYSEPFTTMAQDWFRASLLDDYDLRLKHFDTREKGSGRYFERDWMLGIEKKIRLILEAIEEHWDGWFVYSDVDVVFFRETRPYIEPRMSECDLLFQADDPWGTYNTGLFACRGNPGTRKLWTRVLDELDANKKRHDQQILNEALIPRVGVARFQWRRTLNKLRSHPWGIGRVGRYAGCASNDFGLAVGCLPPSFLCGGTFTGRGRRTGENPYIPEDIVLYHANYCVGIDTKLQHLEYVRDVVHSRQQRRA